MNSTGSGQGSCIGAGAVIYLPFKEANEITHIYIQNIYVV